MNILHWALIVLNVFVVLIAAGHALFYKRDPRAALGWIAVSIIFPLAGPLLYYLFGINRVRTRAKKLERRTPFQIDLPKKEGEEKVPFQEIWLRLPEEAREIARVSEAVTRRPLVAGNRIQILHNGEQTYPSMLEAIEGAKRFAYLSTYIFDTDDTGRSFIEAIHRAVDRHVHVRAIIDGIGEFYSFPRAQKLMRKRGIRVARFMPPRLLPPSVHINLRNHRKILVVDGKVGFAGGMNIGDRHLADNPDNKDRVVDVHFRVSGPVVSQMAEIFLEDWVFTTGERESPSFPACPETGKAICRAIMDGPNEDPDKLAMILVAAFGLARRKVMVMTPYFLPSRELIGAMQAAALRGVEVTVVLPAKNNLPFVHWATRNMLWELLQRGVRIYYQPPPFVHSKLFLMDDCYALVGSANIDPRSLRLNFEFALEIFDHDSCEILETHFEEARRRSREVTLQEVDSRPLPARTRDALAWLFTPYL
jgi:cardiolipin synthase